MTSPKLRFRGFEERWESVCLENLASVERGKFSVRPRNDPRYFGGEMPFVQTGDISATSLYLHRYSQTLNEAGISVSKVFPKNTILITIAANIGDTAVTLFPVACPDSLVAIQPYKDRAHVLWLKFALDLKRDDLNAKATQNAQKNINLQVLRPLTLLSPSFPEQQKIASFLSAVDEKISQLQKKKDSLTRYKQGVMQKIFSQELRFKDENGREFPEWDGKRLGNVLAYEQPTEYLVSKANYDPLYKTPVLTAGKTFILGYTNEDFGVFEKRLPVIIFDDFTTSIKYVNFPFKVKSSAMKILFNEAAESDLRFVFEVMTMLDFPLGDEHKRYWISEYQNQEIDFPCLEEQQKIASFLSTLDEKIQALEEQIDVTQNWKKGLLQQMFV